MITARTHTLPLKTAERLIHIPSGISRSSIAEIRMRSGRPAMLVTVSGQCVKCSESLTRSDIEECFLELCRHSVHSFSREIAEGYITLDGGHRAGFCGTAIMRNGQLETLRDISSIDLRLAHEIKGCAEAIYQSVFADGLHSLLVAGSPLSGKTTILRDLARLIGEKHRVSLIDSRSELAAVCNGTPTLDIGLNTDVLNGYPRAEGMMTALRTLSPEVIICDEIGNDHEAAEQCLNCGVKLIAAVHAGSVAELKRNSRTAQLTELFEFVAVLSGKGQLSELKKQGA